MNRYIGFVFIIVCLVSRLYAQSMVTLNANQIEYSNTTTTLVASQNVELVYRGYRSISDYFEFDPISLKGIISGNVSIIGPSQEFQCNEIDYDGKIYSGKIDHISGRFGKFYVWGDFATLDISRIKIVNATVTGCDKNNPDYTLNSSELQVFPEWGVIVAFNNWVTFGGVPIIWMPTFIYGSKDYSLLAANSSIPEFGVTPREGAYIRQKFGYFFSPANNGSVSIGYAQNLGGIAQLYHHQRLSPSSITHAKIASNGSDGPEYSVALQQEIGEATPKSDLPVGSDDIVNRFKIMDTRVPVTCVVGSSYRENINDSRVSMPYFLDVNWTATALFGTLITGDGLISNRRVEEWTLDRVFNADQETIANVNLNRVWDVAVGQSLSAGAFYYGNFYTQSSWQRLFVVAAYHFSLPEFAFDTTYSQRLFSTSNLSPFEYERKYSIQGTEIGIKLLLGSDHLKYGIESNFDIEAGRARSFDLVVVPQFHCWKLPLRWKSIESQLSFSVELN